MAELRSAGPLADDFAVDASGTTGGGGAPGPIRPGESAPVVHIFTFPALTLNHAVVAYSVSESPEGFQFATYDPNAPNDILDLRFDFSRREF